MNEQICKDPTTTFNNVVYPDFTSTTTRSSLTSSIQNKYYSYNESFKEIGDDNMAEVNWQDKYLTTLDDSIKEINQNLTNTENRISEMINKHIEYSTHLDKQRHEEILNINNKIDSSISEISSKIDSTNSKIGDTNKWIIGLVITTIIGVVGIVIAALSAIS